MKEKKEKKDKKDKENKEKEAGGLSSQDKIDYLKRIGKLAGSKEGSQSLKCTFKTKEFPELKKHCEPKEISRQKKNADGFFECPLHFKSKKLKKKQHKAIYHCIGGKQNLPFLEKEMKDYYLRAAFESFGKGQVEQDLRPYSSYAYLLATLDTLAPASDGKDQPMDTADKTKEDSVLTASDLQTLEKLVEEETSGSPKTDVGTAAPISPDKMITENDNSASKDPDVIVATAYKSADAKDSEKDIHSGNLLFTIEELKKIISHQANELNYLNLVNRQLTNENSYLKTENQRLNQTNEALRKTNPNNGKDERPTKKQKKAKSTEDQENTESEAEKQVANATEQQPQQPQQQ